jgi:hypothetical protein
MCDVADSFSNVVNCANIKKRLTKSLENFIDYMADSGYCNTDDDEKAKKLQVCFRNLVKELIYITCDATNKTITASATRVEKD